MKDNSYITTYTGKKFYPLSPDPEAIDIIDIAHALSNICRYTGHCPKFYSVAQHSCWVSSMSSNKLAGLLHDASEAYLSDIARPVKHHPDFEFYRKAEDRVMVAVCSRFGLGDIPEDIKVVDKRVLATEMRDMFLNRAGNVPWEPFSFTINPISPKKAERLFMGLFESLTRERNDVAKSGRY